MCAIANNTFFSSKGRVLHCNRRMKNCGSSVGKMFSIPLNALMLAAIFGIFLFFGDFNGIPGSGPKAAFGADFQMTPIAVITTDAEGRPLRYPYMLFFDSAVDEIYLSSRGGSQVIIYTRDFYPLVSFGAARGLDSPGCIFVDDKGMIYICQNQSADKTKPNRISIFNGAFIAVREIPLDNIPGVPEFIPNRVAVNRDGIIYVTGNLQRGVLVLDNDGVFLRWLQPEDVIQYDWNADEIPGEEEEGAENGSFSEPDTDQEVEIGAGVDIPEEFLPKSKSEMGDQPEEQIGPVMIRTVSIDSTGRLYLLSNETNKTYVYSPDESFLFSFGDKGGSPRQLSNPRSLAIDDDRHFVYVVDYMRHAVLAYDQNNGDFLFEFGGRGKSPGWFSFPNDVAVNQAGQVIVSDFFNHRLQVLDIKYQRELSLPQEPEQTSPPPESSDLIEEISPDADLSGPQEDSSMDENITDEPPVPEQPADSIAEEVILEEEVIEKSPPGQLPPGQSEEEPLFTPE